MGIRLYKIYRLILEITSVPLAFLLYLMFLTGYGLVKSYAVERVTLGLLDYVTCIQIHTSLIIRVALLILAMIHGLAGFQLMALRIKNKYMRLSFKVALWLVTIVILLQILLIELT